MNKQEKDILLCLADEPYTTQRKAVGRFPDGDSALMPVCARLRHVVGTQWGNML